MATFTVDADVGSFAFTGEPADLLAGYAAPADLGSFAVTGEDATLAIGYQLFSDFGSYTLDGRDANLAAQYQLPSDAGSFTLAGQATTLSVGYQLSAAVGGYTLAGQNARLVRGYRLPAAVSTYTLSGQNATFGKIFRLRATEGIYTFEGQTAPLRAISVRPSWQALNSYSVGDVVKPTATQPDGLFFQVTTAGTSGTTQPFWPKAVGSTIEDGSVTWTAISLVVADLRLPAPSSIIELFELDLFTEIHGVTETYRFHAGTNLVDNGNIFWQGRQYIRFPIEADGFDYTAQGQLPRPKLRISNILGSITGLILSLPRGLEGARVTRIRTLAKYIDDQNFPGNANPFGPADSSIEFPREIFFIDRKSAENRGVVEFEIVSAMDLAGIRAPKRQCIGNICQWKYRSAECTYTGTTYYDSADQPVANASQDVCGKRLTSCRLRFGQNAELPYGSFPGIGKIAG